MAFLTRSKYDLFICHARVDDEPPSDAQEGWVQTFLHGLQVKLDEKLGGTSTCSVRVQDDPPDDPQTEKRLLEELQSSALLVVIASPAYVASRWCHPQDKALPGALRQRIQSGKSVFLVERDKIDESQRPVEFNQLRPHKFWIEGTSGGPSRILGFPKPPHDDPPYYDMLTDLIFKIDAELRRLKDAEQTFLSSQTSSGAVSFARDTGSGKFDVFLCHNSADKPSVIRIGERLKAFGLRPWLDAEQLTPGLPWQRLLEKQISVIASAAVFIGAKGIGPWQEEELDGFLREFKKRHCPVIPVLLPEAPRAPEIPMFLGSRTWIDFRDPDSDPLGMLYWGITGKKMSESRPVVFLAEVTEDLDEARSSVERYLQQNGIPVLPNARYSQNAAEFQSSLERDLAQSALFVQLLSALPGRRLTGSEMTYVSFQCEWAVKAKKTVLQWRRSALDLTSVSSTDHLKLLERDTVAAVTLEEFKSVIREEAFRVPPKVAQRPVHAYVFVNWESEDAALANQVKQVLKQLGADTVFPPNWGTPQDVRKSLEKNLSECDGVIIVYGKTTADWVGEQLRQCRKIVADRGPDRPLKAVGVFEGPPGPKVPLDIDLHNMKVLNCLAGVTEDELHAFLESVQPEGKS